MNKLRFIPSLALVLLATACSGSSASVAQGDNAVPADENDITKSHTFKCTYDGADGFDNLTVAGTGDAATISVKNDQGTYTGKMDPSYPSSRTAPENKDFRRFTWEKDDPWQDTGSSIMLVHKDVLAGKAGEAKYQVSGEGFENVTMKCTPKPA